MSRKADNGEPSAHEQSVGDAENAGGQRSSETAEILRSLPEGLPESVRLAAIQQSQYSGPLPPPALYQEFEKVLPGSAERILAMAEKEQSHRHEWEGVALNATILKRDGVNGSGSSWR